MQKSNYKKIIKCECAHCRIVMHVPKGHTKKGFIIETSIKSMQTKTKANTNNIVHWKEEQLIIENR
jgi:hypothetical protein